MKFIRCFFPILLSGIFLSVAPPRLMADDDPQQAELQASKLKVQELQDQVKSLKQQISTLEKTLAVKTAETQPSSQANMQADTILAQLITNHDPKVRRAAIEMVGVGPLTPTVIDALWRVATGPVLSDLGGSQTIIMDNLKPDEGFPNAFLIDLDGGRYVQNSAYRILIDFKDPSIADRIHSFLALNAKDPHAAPAFSFDYGMPASGMIALAETYQIKEAIPFLMKIAAGPLSGVATYKYDDRTAYITSRTGAIAAVCIISGQKPEDYKLHKEVMNGWSVPDAASENQAVEKIAKWYEGHKGEFNSTTQPATQDAH